MSPEPILTVKAVRKLYPVSRGLINTLRRRPKRYVHALDGVSFDLQPGEILGLVGESGSGKTTIAMSVLGLIDPSAGEIRFEANSVPEMARGRDRLTLRRQIQIVFQDPYSALNPRQTIFQILAEPLEIHGLARTKAEKVARVAAALTDVGLRPPETFFERHPEDLSGGQRQRVVIASALILEPKLLVADEPVSMLDVSIRAEILNLLRDLRDQHGITILYITHDLATAGFFTDRIAVMYLGRIVEIGPTAEVLTRPRHPYTRALLSVVPVPNPRHRRKRVILQGEIPNPIDLPSGCRFHPRCPERIERCTQIDPPLYDVGKQHCAACLLVAPTN
ncbi:MAG TPA: oligopeptide/dipeptide ABC transporter ATP-binding protein [Phototrophicaceae bacterium]|nr:oligopeptide/dipeptide ABC transporter ATP-binding protein [Phototrophicaceae bacterium]